ncbi:MAG: pirin family protein [Alphaproteobacteria bacterium]|nr:pirin family protein [Alphaproteobacteria bacterium]
MHSRKVKRLHPSYRDDIGDLVTRRAIPGPGLEHLDPFLFLNHHGPQAYEPNNRGLPFGPHPHRGFETVTFILDGELSHLDSGGHESVIHPGGVQWMTAGRGVVHAELSPESFKRHGGPLEILQLWINLPASLKMTEPFYAGLEAADIPTVELPGAKLHLVSQDWGEREAPIKPLADVRLMTIELAPGGRIQVPVAAGRSVFLYIVRGSAEIDGTPAPTWNLAELEDEGDGVSMASAQGALILFGHGAAFAEPIVAHGPFVMNSREQIVEAISDYQAGRFGSL